MGGMRGASYTTIDPYPVRSSPLGGDRGGFLITTIDPYPVRSSPLGGTEGGFIYNH